MSFQDSAIEFVELSVIILAIAGVVSSRLGKSRGYMMVVLGAMLAADIRYVRYWDSCPAKVMGIPQNLYEAAYWTVGAAYIYFRIRRIE